MIVTPFDYEIRDSARAVGSAAGTVVEGTRNVTPPKKNTSSDNNTTPPDNLVQVKDVFMNPPIPAEFPGGDEALQTYIKHNKKYPKEAKTNNIKGYVHLFYIIEQDGSIGNIKVMKGLSDGCTEEAIRLVKEMPKWKPAYRSEGRPVRVRKSIKIDFGN